MERKYKLPAIVWLRITDYMHGWVQYELGGAAMIGDQRVVSVQHIPGARRILRMETYEDILSPGNTGKSMSATRYTCVSAGMNIDATATEELYGVTKEELQLYVPIECPKMCLTKNGVLRPWTLDVGLSRKQATAMQDLLRNEFWKAVETYDHEYARKMGGKKYPAVEMVEEFCADTETPDMYVDAIRREWQRRVKRRKEASVP